MIKKQYFNAKFIYYIFFLINLIGCSSTSEKIFNEKAYTLGMEAITVNKGNIIASELNGEVKTKRSWVGIMSSEDGWGEAKLTYSNNFIEKKLYYLGYDAPYLHLMYREYRRGETEPSILKLGKTNPDQNPFSQLGIFNLKILSVDGLQANLLLLDNNAWENEQKKFLIVEDERQKAEKLEQIIRLVEAQRNEAEAAKNYAEQFNEITGSLGSFFQASNEFNTLNSKTNGLRNNNYSSEQLIEIYQTLRQQFSEYSQFFTLVASTLRAWDTMDSDFRKAAQSGIGKEYFTMALDIKNSGMRDLQGEQFSSASQKFMQAQQEANRIIDYFKNPTSGNIGW